MIEGAVELRRKLDRVVNFLTRGAIARKAGLAVLRHSAESFDAARDPETGSPWPALKPSSAARPRKGPLNVTGQLRASLNLGGPGNVFRQTGTDVEIGTSDPNAAWTLGTRPHVIVPRGSVLAWEAAGIHFAKRVNHPGTPMRRILGVDRKTGRTIEIELSRDVEREMTRV